MSNLTKRVLRQSKYPTLKSLTPLKYAWAKRLYDYSNSCIWLPAIVRMDKDISDYHNCSKEDRLAYERTLGYLNAADIAATENVARGLSAKIDAPEIEATLCSIAYQETNHAYSYLYMLQSLGMDHGKQDEINHMYLKVPAMSKKLDLTNRWVEHMISLPDEDMSDADIEEFVHAYFFFSQIFEGCFFMAGFNPIYSIYRKNESFANSRVMLNYIRRDEEKLHVNTGMFIIREILREHPNVKLRAERVHDMLREAYDLEEDYITFVMGDGLKGYSKSDHLRYFKYLSNKSCSKFKLPELYPVDHVENLSWVRDVCDKGLTNTFELKNIEYDLNSGVRDSFDP